MMDGEKKVKGERGNWKEIFLLLIIFATACRRLILITTTPNTTHTKAATVFQLRLLNLM